jgi:endonuclease/exonuclease/phosphatase family metal-dependent hydrolase
MTKRVTALTLPSQALRHNALAAIDQQTAYASWHSQFECLHEIQRLPAARNVEAPTTLRIGAWNLERGRHWYEASQLIQALDLDVILLSEMDLGMARSDQQHTTRQLAEALNYHALFAVEFVELELGSEWELTGLVDTQNEAGLHGNAILSRYPLHSSWLHRFTNTDGHWWHREFHEPRAGGRMALGADILTAAGPVTLISTHLENNTSPSARAGQVTEIIARVDERDTAIVIGGDFNTSTIDPTTSTDPFRLRTELVDQDPHRFIAPFAYEPLFDLLASHGFWRGTANTGDTTQRMRERGYPKPPLGRIDWIFNRACVAFDAQCHPALNAAHQTLSDHDLVTCQIRVD